MSCPKCGFVSATGSECPRCGVLFSKIERKSERPVPARTTVAAAAPTGFSRGFKLTLAAIFVLVAAAILIPLSHPPPETGAGPPPRPRDDPEIQPLTPIPIQSSPALRADSSVPVPVVTASPPPRTDIPSLPKLDKDTATPALLAHAKELALEHPGTPWLQQYVVNAHFWIAQTAISERRFSEAARVLDESEEWGALEGDVASYRATLHRDQRNWKVASQWAQTALRLDSRIDPAEMHHVVGLAYYYREELSRAIEEYEMALGIREDPAIRASLDEARRDARTADGFSQKRLSHFIVRYEGQTMEDIGRMAIDTLERNYSSLVSELGFEPSEPVAVILYTQRSYREMGGPHWSAGVYDGKIRIPVQGISWGDEHIRRTLHHELAHAFVRSKVGENVPRWLNEGLAEYVEGTRTRTVGHRLSPLIADGRSLEDCVVGTGCDYRIFYPAAASMVDYVIQLRGMGGVRDVLEGLARGDDIDACLRRTFGKDERALVRDWELFLRRRV